jgi:DNA-binding CsgD family transcriptional regulator
MTMAPRAFEGVDEPPLLLLDEAAGPRLLLPAVANADVEEIDLSDVSGPLANTCAALRLCLVEGDLEAATRVFPMLVGQVADLRAVAGQLLQPLFADALTNAPSPQHASLFVDTARDLLDTVAARRERTAPQVWLHSVGGQLEPLLLRLIRMLLDELGVPSRVVGDSADGASPLPKLPLRRGHAVCLAVPDVASLDGSRELLEWLTRRQVAVVVVGDVVRNDPDAVAAIGVSATALSVTAAVDDMLWVRGPLTAAESTALRMAADGYTNVRIAHELGISVSAVKARLESSYHRLRASDRAHAVAIALRNRWIR